MPDSIRLLSIDKYPGGGYVAHIELNIDGQTATTTKTGKKNDLIGRCTQEALNTELPHYKIEGDFIYYSPYKSYC
jgi:hypothetical protein